MYPPLPDLSPEIAEILRAGMAIGHNQSFALVSGRCSAAQAEALHRLRESRCYQPVAGSWKEFCPQFLNMSSSRADRIIRCWQEFGPSFFELHNLISISPEVYRSIEPAIQNGAIHCNQEAIAFDPENSQKVLAAVTELRKSLSPKPPPPPPTVEDRLEALDRTCDAVVAEFHQIAGMMCKGAARSRFEIVLNRASAALQRLEMDLGIS
ncbi:MAG TPA: hypothetical protein VMH81_01960 [Bryobacteraceae bacterium]|nr:hypothetical protein [Bryobacteraceae bacterium]